MAETSGPPVANRIIEALPVFERHALLDHCTEVTLAFGDVLYEQHEPCTSAYFPLTAFISQMARVNGHPPMEMGMVGHEGMLGASLLLNVELAPQLAVVQGPGVALRISTAALRDVMDESPALRSSMQRYLFGWLVAMGQTTVCTRFHVVDARLARWLLMSQDRTHADHFRFTHQFLADMLGVQRSAVSIASGVLKNDGLIAYSRGRIRVLDRRRLEAAACECYATERSTVYG